MIVRHRLFSGDQLNGSKQKRSGWQLHLGYTHIFQGSILQRQWLFSNRYDAWKKIKRENENDNYAARASIGKIYFTSVKEDEE